MKGATGGDPMAEGIFRASNTALLGTAEPADSLLHQVSPARLVDKNTPPTFLWATAEDSLVPVQHTVLMANALAQQKIPFEMHIFESGSHGLSTAGQSSAGSVKEVDEDAAKWIGLCDAWLKKRFAFELQEMREWERNLL